MNKEDNNDIISKLKEKLDYVDSLTIIDNNGKILKQLRYNPRFTKEKNEIENQKLLNRNILEVFPSITPETSTLFQVIKTGKVFFADKQTIEDYKGQKITNTNINFPIVSRGKIIGAIELSKDITNIGDSSSKTKKMDKNLTYDFNTDHTAKYKLDDIITQSSSMKSLKKYINKIASSTSSVLIYGETGTGKELFAQSIHNESNRKNYPFVAVNCTALPETLLESILFGTIKGSFTGAENKKGLFETAKGGTIYLDEINSMSLNMQAKLLRALQEKNIMKVGSNKYTKIDVRVISSINKSPKEVLQNGEIRKDLFYRLNVINIKIPPLRQRIEDIEVLSNYFINKFNLIFNKEITKIDKDVNQFFDCYNWPGNVRELEHVIEAAMNISEGNEIKMEHLPVYLNELELNNNIEEHIIESSLENLSLNDFLEKIEKNAIKNALIKTSYNISKAARYLKVERTTLIYKIKKYKIPR